MEQTLAPVVKFDLFARRKLLLDRPEYLRWRRAVIGAAPDTPIVFRPKSQMELRVLSARTIRWAAKRSENFHGLTANKLQEELELVLPPSAQNRLKPDIDKPVQPWHGTAQLAFRLKNAPELIDERSRLFAKLCNLAGLAISGLENYPSVVLAYYPLGVVPPEAIEALQSIQPPSVQLGRLVLLSGPNKVPDQRTS